MVEEHRERGPDTVERTTIVETDRGRGGGGVLTAVLLILALLVLLFLFRDQFFNDTATTEIQVPDKIDVNVN